MTHYVLPDTRARIDYDRKTGVIEISGLTETDRVIHRTDNRDYSQVVIIELGKDG